MREEIVTSGLWFPDFIKDWPPQEMIKGKKLKDFQKYILVNSKGYLELFEFSKNFKTIESMYECLLERYLDRAHLDWAIWLLFQKYTNEDNITQRTFLHSCVNRLKIYRHAYDPFYISLLDFYKETLNGNVSRDVFMEVHCKVDNMTWQGKHESRGFDCTAGTYSAIEAISSLVQIGAYSYEGSFRLFETIFHVRNVISSEKYFWDTHNKEMNEEFVQEFELLKQCGNIFSGKKLNENDGKVIRKGMPSF